jgi:uncharacterized protein
MNAVTSTNGALPAERARSVGIPFHLFEKGGQSFVYDLSSGRFLHIDQQAHTRLDERLSALAEAPCNFEPGISANLLGARDEMDEELDLLAEQGLFDIPQYGLSDQEMKRQSAARYSTRWNKLELALAETCNLACGYCYCGTCRGRKSKPLMSEATAKTAIDWLFDAAKDSKSVHITLFGGEPLLNKPVFKFVMDYSDKIARHRGIQAHYSLTTNGTMLDETTIDYIKKHNFGLMVSLDGPPEIHNAQCPFQDGRPSFDAAAQGIRALMRRRRSVTVRCTLTNRKSKMLDLVQFFEEFGFTRIVLGRAVNPVHASPLDCNSDTLEEYDQQEEEEVLPWLFEQWERGWRPKYFPYGSFVLDQSRANDRPSACMFKCGACRGTMTVGTDGLLYPCHRYVGMNKYVLGHIDSGPSLEKAGEFWRDYNEAVGEKCDVCWARHLCNRPCPWELSKSDGTFVSPDDKYCAMIRSYYERAAYVLYRLQTDFPEMWVHYCGEPIEDIGESVMKAD